MREIKFRAWSKQLQRMVQSGFYLRNCDNHIFYETEDGDWQEYTPDDITLMQYTGLKDKNGVEIFESDLVELDGKKELFEVVFNQGGFVAKRMNCVIYNSFSIGVMTKPRIEIIGNIYQDSHLLGQRCV